MNTLVDFGGWLQHARFITLACARQEDLVDDLAVEQFTGHEGINAAASMNLATPGTVVASAGEQMHWTTQGDSHLAAGTTFAAVAGGSTSLFTHSGGMQAIAANGPVSLQAHTDRLEIVADKEVVTISVNGHITIKASRKLVMQAGRSSITLAGGDITFACPGNFTAKGGQHIFDGGVRAEASCSALPSSVASFYNRKVQLKDENTGAILPDMPYFVRLNSGVVFHGVTDRDGLTDLAQSDSAESAKAYIGHAALIEIEKFRNQS